MNSKRLLLLGSIAITFLMLNSCSESDDDPNPCLGDLLVSVDNVIASVEGKSTGEITASASGGAGPYMFSIDGSNFQSDGTFTDVSAGSYTVTVKDANDCTDAESSTVAEVKEVFYANQIRPILDNNCQTSNCHGDNQNIPTFATYDDVKARADRIKARTTAMTMPPSGPLSDGDINLIADWVDQGAPNN